MTALHNEGRSILWFPHCVVCLTNKSNKSRTKGNYTQTSTYALIKNKRTQLKSSMVLCEINFTPGSHEIMIITVGIFLLFQSQHIYVFAGSVLFDTAAFTEEVVWLLSH